MESFGKHEVGTAMPPCSIQHQRNLFVRTSSNTSRKVLQGQGHHWDVDPRQEQPDGPSRLWMHKAVDVHPLRACLHDDPRTRAFPHPDPPEQGFETDAMLIEGPEFDTGGRMVLLDRGYLERKFF